VPGASSAGHRNRRNQPFHFTLTIIDDKMRVAEIRACEERRMEMSSLWENLDATRAILTASTVVPFSLFASAGIWHFGAGAKSGTNLVSVASLLGFAAIIYAVWAQYDVYLWSAVGVALQSISVFIFGWCIGTSGRRNLSLAFGDSRSAKLLTEGPYSVVRHPFYTSYIIFWIGGIAVACSVFTIAAALVMIGIYFDAARREDKVLAKRFEDEFIQWRGNTGAFFPKLR
jgi:protein-S-isoprenylcysteine O-methyltransferase Ste14